MHNIENRIRTVMAKVLQVAPQAISSDISRENLPAWDSLKHMNLMLALEDEFGIEFTDREIISLINLQLLEGALRPKLS